VKTCSICKKVLPPADFCGGKSSYSCKPCMKTYKRKNHLANREKRNAQSKASHQRRMQNPEYRAKHNGANSTKQFLSWYHRNKDKARAIRDRYRAKPETKIMRAAHTRNRQAQLISAQPKWANTKYIALFYRFAKLEQERTGKKVEVDHIVPLQHSRVCGLHCEHNLQLLTARANKIKNNTF